MIVRAAAILVVGLTAIVYRGALDAYFFQDDFQWLAGTLTYHPASLLDFTGREHFYRPVIELYFWALTPLVDGSPRAFHAANVALHAANGLLVLLLARAYSGSDRFALVAAVCFVVMPGYVEAITWVSALAEPVAAFCAGWMLYAFHRSRTGPAGWAGWRAVSLAAFAAALMTHESSVVLLPILMAADWAFAGAHPSAAAVTTAVRRYGPYALVAAAYLVPDMLVNTRSYLIEEGHYRIGWHAVRNTLDYIVWLYVGKRAPFSYALVAGVLAWIAWRGTPMARFAVAWMLLALLPFAFFTWGNTSRYLYLPAIGFAFLLAEGIERLAARLPARLPPRARHAIIALLVAAVAGRFAYFATRAVANFTDAAGHYRALEDRIRAEHPAPSPGSAIPVDAGTLEALHHRYVEALVQWTYRDPALVVIPR
jgi:hypothetical protein